MAKPTENYICVIVHVVDGEPIMAEMDGLPGPTDTFVRLRNPRSRDNKPAIWLSPNARSLVYSASYITFIEVIDDTEAIGWVRVIR